MSKIFLNEDFINEIVDLERGIDVAVNDTPGVKGLLDRISKREEFEWGTILKVERDGDGHFAICSVYDSYEAEGVGIVNRRKEDGVIMDIGRALNMGYNSTFHYHPNGNYLPSFEDVMILRQAEMDVAFLGFNLNGEPRIRAYNGICECAIR